MAYVAANLMTAEELYALPNSGLSNELVRGERRMMTPASYDHGQVESNIVYFLSHFVRSSSSGEVLTSDTGFLLSRNPDTVRCADGSFVRRGRMNPDGRRGPFYPGAPD